MVDADFGLIGRDGGEAPFGWERHVYADVDADFAPLSGGGAALRLRNDAPTSRLVLSQAVQLVPGRILLQAQVTSDGRPARDRLVAALTCGMADQLPGNVSGDLAHGGQTLTVPPCDNAILSLWLKPGADEITVSRLQAATGH